MYLGLPQLSKMESSAVIINHFYSSTIIANFSILDVTSSPGYVWEMLIKIVSVKLYAYSKQNFYYKDLFHEISRPASAYLLGLNFRESFFLEITVNFVILCETNTL